MKKFNTTLFLTSEGAIRHIAGYVQAVDEVSAAVPSRDYYARQAAIYQIHFDHLKDLDIPMSRLAVGRYLQSLKSPNCRMTMKEIFDGAEEIRARLYDELEVRGHFFYIPMARAKHFDNSEPFGVAVLKKFPKLTEDIQEAEKCYACGRHTACVFHLMRVMEHAVQRLGSRLRVKIDVSQSTWQTILNSISGAVKLLDHKKARTQKYAEIASHLYNVKVAWRNEVMHPKATYTEEEAEILLQQVEVFLTNLARVL